MRLDEARELVVGWDPPLRTFFAQVYDTSVDEDENPIVWLGADERLPHLGDLTLALLTCGDPTLAVALTLSVPNVLDLLEIDRLEHDID